MSTKNPLHNTLHFISLKNASRSLGARSPKEFLKDLRQLTPQERREVADLVKKEG